MHKLHGISANYDLLMSECLNRLIKINTKIVLFSNLEEKKKLKGAQMRKCTRSSIYRVIITRVSTTILKIKYINITFPSPQI